MTFFGMRNTTTVVVFGVVFTLDIRTENRGEEVSYNNEMHLVCGVCAPEGAFKYPPEAAYIRLAGFSCGWGRGSKCSPAEEFVEELENFFDDHVHPEQEGYNEQFGTSHFWLFYETTTEKYLKRRKESERRRESVLLERFQEDPKAFVYKSPLDRLSSGLTEDDIREVQEIAETRNRETQSRNT